MLVRVKCVPTCFPWFIFWYLILNNDNLSISDGLNNPKFNRWKSFKGRDLNDMCKNLNVIFQPKYHRNNFIGST